MSRRKSSIDRRTGLRLPVPGQPAPGVFAVEGTCGLRRQRVVWCPLAPGHVGACVPRTADVVLPSSKEATP